MSFESNNFRLCTSALRICASWKRLVKEYEQLAIYIFLKIVQPETRKTDLITDSIFRVSQILGNQARFLLGRVSGHNELDPISLLLQMCSSALFVCLFLFLFVFFFFFFF